MSGTEFFSIIAVACGTLLLQVSIHLSVGHWLRLQHRNIPREALFLLLLYVAAPVIASGYHQNWNLGLLSMSVGLAYVMGFNPASGIRSPTFRILGLMIEQKRPVVAHEILGVVREDKILERKIADLVNDGWISVKDGSAILSPIAKAMVSLFKRYRALLNLSEGTG